MNTASWRRKGMMRAGDALSCPRRAPPRRQERTAAGEIHISMADPPSLLYSAVRSAEWDRSYVTTLTGPSGSKSVSWSMSTVVVNGKVTKNTLT